MEISSSQSDLPSLPNEVWHKIFSYLTYSQLKTSSLVSKSWLATVLDSMRFTTRTRLNLDVMTKKDWNVMRMSERKYRQVVIRSCKTLYVPPTLAIWTNLAQLHLSSCTFDGPNFLNLLRNCSSLKALLILPKCEILDTSKIVIPVTLKLTDLSLHNKDESTDWIMDHLHCTEISNYLEVRGSEAPNWKADSVVRFLNRLEGNIKYLHIENINLDNTKAPITPSFTFKWGNLYLNSYDIDMEINETSLTMKQLCEASAENSTLSLAWWSQSHVNIALQILKFCRNAEGIVNFDCVGHFCLTRPSELKSIGEFDKLLNLKIACETIPSDDSDVNTAFLSMFTNVEKLSLECASNGFFEKFSMKLICSKLMNVTSLKIKWDESGTYDGNNDLFKDINLPKLESITLGPIEIFAESAITLGRELAKLSKRHRKLKTVTFMVFSENFNQLMCEEVHTAISEQMNDNRLNVRVARSRCFHLSPLRTKGMMTGTALTTVVPKSM